MSTAIVRVMKFVAMAFVAAMLSANAWGQAERRGEAPAERSEVAVVSGGIGAAARQALEENARTFNLKLVFALASGRYLSDVVFEVTDAAGKPVVQHVAYGPIAYVRLPPGRYTIKASLDGAAQTRTLAVDRRGQKTVHFRWQAEPVAR